MTKRTFFKTVRRAVTRSLGRFIAIIAIVALGVGFLTGLMATTPDMQKTVDAYFDDYNAADLEVRATTPLTDADVDNIRAAEGVSGVMPAFSMDIPISRGDENPVARLYLYDFAADGNDDINRLELIEGRLPESKTECLVERSGSYLMDVRPGDKLTYETDLLPVPLTFTVSGVVGNPWYFSNQREQTSAGNGRLGTVVYADWAIWPEGLPRVITNVFATVAGAKKLDAFSDKYDDTVTRTADRVREAVPNATADTLFVLDRSYNVSFKSFDMAAEKVAAVAVVFPAFFFLVAALVALTTMTRMVEDERLQIGTLKALGYGKATILLKYVIYALIAGVIGCAIGVLAGFQLLPAVIWNAYKFMFHLPKLAVHFNVWYAGISSLAALAAILAATVFACVRSLRERPAQLLQPRAPKPGGRIALERIPGLWNRLKFKYKSTLRNLFRYKKHFIMTVVGVGGCTALMLTGFGLKNSTDAIARKQYTEILRYDLTINVTDERSDALDAFLSDKDKITDYALFHTRPGYVSGGGERISATLNVPETGESLERFVKIGNGKKTSAFTDSSVVLTRKAADLMGVKAGDTFEFEDSSGEKVSLTLTYVTENYVNTTLYAGKDVLTGDLNTVLASSPITEEGYDDALRSVLAMPGVTGAQFLAQEKSGYDGLVSSMGSITAVLILAAGALAVIVLYNLININIIERTKELATLKVLGYKPAEVAGYILREIVIMTIVGVLVGLGLGVLLHWFVVGTADTAELMFGRTIAWWSYLAAAAVTLAFSAVVDLIMCVKLKKINMTSSMKAPE